MIPQFIFKLSACIVTSCRDFVMGNCSFKGTAADGFPSSTRILTDSGTVLELKNPKLAREVLEDYPGYGIFPQGHASSPLADDEHLVGGQFYYLLPLEKIERPKMSSAEFVDGLAFGSALEVLPSDGNGVWKVKLVISTEQLEEIFSEEVNTEALIEKMRMAACAASHRTPRWTKNSWLVGWRKPPLLNVNWKS